MAGTNWTVFQPNTKIISSEVNENCDWMEGAIVPMNAGAKTDGVYDLGEDGNRFRSVYLRNGVFDMDATTTSDEIFSVTTGSGNLFKIHGTDSVGIIDSPLQSSMHYRNPAMVSVGTLTGDLKFGTKLHDNQNEYDTNTGQFLVKEAGVYSVAARVGPSFGSVTSGIMYLWLYVKVNSSTTYHDKVYYVPNDNNVPCAKVNISALKLNAGDNLTCYLLSQLGWSSMNDGNFSVSKIA